MLCVCKGVYVMCIGWVGLGMVRAYTCVCLRVIPADLPPLMTRIRSLTLLKVGLSGGCSSQQDSTNLRQVSLQVPSGMVGRNGGLEGVFTFCMISENRLERVND